MKKLSLKEFKSLSREDMRNTMGGGYDCSSDCTMNSHCGCPGDYCGSLVCNVRGNLWVTRRTCVFSGNGNIQY